MTQGHSLFTLNECIFPADTKFIVQIPVMESQDLVSVWFWKLVSRPIFLSLGLEGFRPRLGPGVEGFRCRDFEYWKEMV